MSTMRPEIFDNKPLFESEILKRYSNDSNFKIMSLHQLPAEKSFINGQFYILNLDGLAGDGSHFVLLYRKDDKYYYFDSFGVPPGKIVRDFCAGLPLVYQNAAIQMISSNRCGAYCMYVADNMKSVGFKDIIMRFYQHSSEYNERLIMSHF